MLHLLSPAHLPAWAVRVAAGNGSGHGLRKAARLAQPAPSVALSHCLKLRACISSPEKSPFPRNTCTAKDKVERFENHPDWPRTEHFLSAFGGVLCCSAEKYKQAEMRALMVLSFPFNYPAPAFRDSTLEEVCHPAFLLTSGLRASFVQNKLRTSPYLGTKLGQK